MTTESGGITITTSSTFACKEEEEGEMFLSTLSRLPVIVILGATGTGKSKLAINLAKKFNGEIISADSMQIYKGLDILTNKVTEEEMNGVPHHMIGVIDSSTKYDVYRFQHEAVPIVQRILLEGKIPFIVGGTNYYIESLLWKVLMPKTPEETLHISTKRKLSFEETSHAEKDEENLYPDSEILRYLSSTNGSFSEDDELIRQTTSQELYSALQSVDPERAEKFHPNDRRKIVRSLQVRFQSGKKHSELIKEQQKQGTLDEEQLQDLRNSHLGGPLRYPNSFCLWIQAPKPMLDERINLRVDEMVGRGLRSELNNYIDHLRKESCGDLDFTRGILQSIGFKEFIEYLQLLPSERHTEVGNKKFLIGTDLLKIATRQYAKKQLRWISQRFLRPSRRQIPPVYWLDGSETEPKVWNQKVDRIAETIIEAHLLNQIERVTLIKERLVPQITDKNDDLIARSCPVCVGRVFVGNFQYNQHLKSIKHKRVQSRANKVLKNEQVQNTSAP